MLCSKTQVGFLLTLQRGYFRIEFCELGLNVPEYEWTTARVPILRGRKPAATVVVQQSPSYAREGVR